MYRFPQIAAAAGVRVDMVAVGANINYYCKKMIVDRLREDVIGRPTSTNDRIWLAGISIGGTGSLLYASPVSGGRRRNRDLRSLFGRGFSDRRSLRGRQPRELAGRRRRSRQMIFSAGSGWALQGFLKRPAHAPIYLGWGETDSFARANGLLAKELPKTQVFTAPGDHEWKGVDGVVGAVPADGGAFAALSPSAMPRRVEGDVPPTPAVREPPAASGRRGCMLPRPAKSRGKRKAVAEGLPQDIHVLAVATLPSSTTRPSFGNSSRSSSAWAIKGPQYAGLARSTGVRRISRRSGVSRQSGGTKPMPGSDHPDSFLRRKTPAVRDLAAKVEGADEAEGLRDGQAFRTAEALRRRENGPWRDELRARHPSQVGRGEKEDGGARFLQPYRNRQNRERRVLHSRDCLWIVPPPKATTVRARRISNCSASSGGTAGERKKPWPYSQPRPRRRARWSAVWMPSATTSMPSWWARVTMALTIAKLPSASSMRETKERSIFEDVHREAVEVVERGITPCRSRPDRAARRGS